MQSSLWKFGALLGVIGVGFLVLMKAQTGMNLTQQEESAEQFSEMEAIEELDDLAQPADPDEGHEHAGHQHDGHDHSGRQQHAAEAEEVATASTDPFSFGAPAQTEPTPAASTGSQPTSADNPETAAFGSAVAREPTPTVAADQQHQDDPAPKAAATEATEQSSDPFAATASTFGAGPPPQTEPEASVESDQQPTTEPAPSGDEPSIADETQHNPLASLVNSFTGDSASPDEPAELNEPVTERTPATKELAENQHQEQDAAAGSDSKTDNSEVADAKTAAPEDFNPFAMTPESPTETESNAESESHSDSESASAAPDPESVATVFPQEDEPSAQAESAEEDAESRTSLPAEEQGPGLMSPPSFSNVEEPSPRQHADAQTGDAQWPAQQAEPAVFETVAAADDTDELNSPDKQTGNGANDEINDNEIVQTGTEQPAPAAEEPNPFLVFPGAEQEEKSAAADSSPAVSRPRSAPKPSMKSFTFSDQSEPAAVTPEAEPSSESSHQGAVVPPEDMLEMTIQPRHKSGEPSILPTQHQQPAASQAPEQFHPFSATPKESSTNDDARRRDDAAQPRTIFPESGQPLSPPPVPPADADVPKTDSTAPRTLTPADYIGVGTVSAETPSTPQQAQLTIQKQAPEDAVLGQDLIYSILVKNIGRSTAKNVVVEDLVPKGSELKGTDPQAQMTPDKKLVWQLGKMEPGAERTIRIKVVPVKAGQIGSVATVSFEAAVASRTIVTAPELQLDVQGPQEVRIGEKAPYVFTLSNVGTADAANVFVRSILPSGFRHPAANEKNDIEYEVGLLKRGESRQVELTLLAVSAGDFQTHAILSADGDVSVESRHPVKIIPSRLKISRTGPSNRFVGREARYISTLTNESSDILRNIVVTESIPTGLKFDSASENGTFNPQQRTVTWQIATLEPGGARRFETLCIADHSGRLETTIRARDQRGNLVDASSETTVAGFSSLTVDVANPGRPIPVGEELALRLKLRNDGTAAANQVRTTIDLPSELRFISVRGPVSYSQQGSQIIFEPIDRIDVESEQTFDVVLAAAQATEDARVVVQLSSNELSKPLSEEESVVIFAEGE